MERKTILAKTYGILPNDGRDYAKNLVALIESLKKEKGGVTVEFETGTYDIYAETAQKELFYITNTLSEKDSATPIHTFGLIFRGLSDVEFDFRNSKLMYHGAMTHIFIDQCEKIRIRNVEIDHKRPPYCSEITCTAKSFLHADFTVHEDSDYEIVGNDIMFKGENWTFSGIKDKNIAGYIPRQKDGKMRGGLHPFKNMRKITENGKGKISVSYYLPSPVEVGTTYAIINTKRLECGIVVNRSSGVYLENVVQRFNMSHALVAQESKDISLDYCCFAPDKNSGRIIASITDFLHFNMCRGKILVSNSYFEGANDDGINVHGINFPIQSVDGDSVTVKFAHRETYGFNPFEKGDEVAFVNKKTLLDVGTSKVLDCVPIDAYTLMLVLDKVPEINSLETVIENLSTNPDLFYAGNYLAKISTRGVLVSTRGKVNILDNTFKNLGMSGVLIADDANSWFESGPVRNITITGNKFLECGNAGVRVKPETKEFAGPVHKDILIKENSFVVNGKNFAVDMTGVDRVFITENDFSGSPEGPIMKFWRCSDTHITDNEFEKNYVVDKR